MQCTKDLQLKLSTSKATSTTVQDVHPDIARGMLDGKEKARQAYYYLLKQAGLSAVDI